MSPSLLLLIYCILVVLASLLGGWVTVATRLTHTSRQAMMSLVAGLMLGVSLLHLLPHSAVHLTLDGALLWTVTGVLVMFLMIRMLHVHQHGPLEEAISHKAPGQEACSHDHPHEPHHHPHEHHHKEETTVSHLSWAGLSVGLALHTIIDGVALAAGVMSDVEHGSAGWLLGVGVFVVVLLHKPLDSLAITSLMAAAGSKVRTIVAMNAGFAMLCPLGALGFYYGVDVLGGGQSAALGVALAFSAGVFLCLALADILPEVSFHSHDRLLLTGMLLLGVALALAIGWLEPEHLHDHSGHGHDHAGHHDHAH